MSPVLGSVAAGTAVLLALDARPRPVSLRPSPRRAWPRPGATSAALLAAAGTAVLVGGTAGFVLGALIGLAVRLLVPRLETSTARRRHDRMVVLAPLTVDLVTACLASGAGVEDSVRAAARAVGEPVAAVLARATAALDLGADPVSVWREVAEIAELSAFARARARSAETGAPLAALLRRVADEARAAQRSRVETRVRTASVRLTAPLGAALLPAFVLLGVVPVVASWVGVLL